MDINWVIVRTYLDKSTGYVRAKVPNHPNAGSNGYLQYHRVVMENHIGRLLEDNEDVHHINGIKDDNRLCNLEILVHGEHSRTHRLNENRPITYVRLKCPICTKVFVRPRGITHLVKSNPHNATCCSRSCGSKLGMLKYNNNVSLPIQKGIRNNVIEVFKK